MRKSKCKIECFNRCHCISTNSAVTFAFLRVVTPTVTIIDMGRRLRENKH